jgi:hypothetical protein
MLIVRRFCAFLHFYLTHFCQIIHPDSLAPFLPELRPASVEE